MAEISVGYARCSTTSQDVRAQLSALKQLGVTDEHLHTDRGRTGRNRERPGLTAALGAVRDGDVLVVTKLDRLGRSARDLHDIAAELAGKGVKLSIGGSIHDPGDPMGKMFFGMLALMAEFESDLIRSRTVEGMREAAKRGRLLGKPSKLSVLGMRWCAAWKVTGLLGRTGQVWRRARVAPRTGPAHPHRAGAPRPSGPGHRAGPDPPTGYVRA